MRSHKNSAYAWVDVFFGPNKDLMHVINKSTLEIVKTLKPAPGKTAAHVEFTRDGRFFVNTEGPDGELADFELAYTFGVDPLQQYLAPFPGGRLQSLTVAWDTERAEWFHLYPDERVPPGDPLHWTGRYQRWNVMCAECHPRN